MSVLTQAHHDHFDEQGYMLVENAVPTELCDAVVAAIWAFLEMDPDDQNTWYQAPHKPGAGMVEMYQHQAMWNVYQHPTIHQVYSEIYGTDRIWVHPDRVNMKPPQHPDHPDWDHKGMFHWDADVTKLPVRYGTQGVLFLTDTADDQGSFVCWPGAHKSLIDEDNPWAPELDPEKFIQVPAKAGTMLVWHRALPHGNGRNTSDRPRLAQYMNFYPVPEPLNEERRQERITLWRERRALGRGPWPGDPRGWEAKNYGPAELNETGRKLLGLDLWE
ncbi:MAG: phytanoyl-CoA dioxygenase family protein [Candidatus Poribacteria bacterium]